MEGGSKRWMDGRMDGGMDCTHACMYVCAYAETDRPSRQVGRTPGWISNRHRDATNNHTTQQHNQQTKQVTHLYPHPY